MKIIKRHQDSHSYILYLLKTSYSLPHLQLYLGHPEVGVEAGCEGGGQLGVRVRVRCGGGSCYWEVLVGARWWKEAFRGDSGGGPRGIYCILRNCQEVERLWRSLWSLLAGWAAPAPAEMAEVGFYYCFTSIAGVKLIS